MGQFFNALPEQFFHVFRDVEDFGYLLRGKIIQPDEIFAF